MYIYIYVYTVYIYIYMFIYIYIYIQHIRIHTQDLGIKRIHSSQSWAGPTRRRISDLIFPTGEDSSDAAGRSPV